MKIESQTLVDGKKAPPALPPREEFTDEDESDDDDFQRAQKLNHSKAKAKYLTKDNQNVSRRRNEANITGSSVEEMAA